MIIKVFYQNGNQDVFDTSELTETGSLSPSFKNVMTKFHVEWGEFLKNEYASHLNLYIYYYRNDNNQNTKIVSEKYLDKVLFYDNDEQIYKNLSSEDIKRKHKALPYGSMEPGTWFTLVPFEDKNDILRIDVDGVTRLYRHHLWNDLIDIFKFNMLKEQYLSGSEKSLDLESQIDILFDRLINISLNGEESPALEETDIAYEMGIPYQLIIQIKKRIAILENMEKEKEEQANKEKFNYLNKDNALTLISFAEECLLVLRNWFMGLLESSKRK